MLASSVLGWMKGEVEALGGFPGVSNVCRRGGTRVPSPSTASFRDVVATSRGDRVLEKRHWSKHIRSKSAFPVSIQTAIMTHLDLFLQKGPANGDVVAGLEELRRIVLLDGIPSNSDGMVRQTLFTHHTGI